MKRSLLLLFTLFLISIPCVLFITCAKQNADRDLQFYSRVKSNATIAGIDARMCPCCGGYFLSIENQKPIGGDYFITYSFPGGYKPTSFPVKVYIEWEKDVNPCINDKITVTKLTQVTN